MTPSDAYFAGFFDADGTVGITKAGPQRHLGYGINLSVSNVNIDVIDEFQLRFGGSTGVRDRRDGTRPVWYWILSGRAVEAFLEAIEPYLIVKRERVQLAIEFRRLYHGQNRLHGKPESEVITINRARDDCYKRMMKLNEKGRPM